MQLYEYDTQNTFYTKAPEVNRAPIAYAIQRYRFLDRLLFSNEKLCQYFVLSLIMTEYFYYIQCPPL